MKLVTFTRRGSTHIGKLVEHNGAAVVDLTEAGLPAEMISFLQGGAPLLEKAAHVSSDQAVPLASVKLHAPIPRPGKIICIGLNYSDHAAETGQAIPKFPVVFAKYANTVIADGEAIVLPKVTEQVDYEAELGFVIGTKVRGATLDDAMAYVAGYLPVNDVSARDYQNRTSQWSMGKTFDTFAPMGPALVTADEVPDPHNLSIRLTIGGETLQNSNTSNLIFNIPQLIVALSEVMTLEPGDVVSTGTPPGVGMARKPQRWMRAGETCTITIEKVGTLHNPVVAEGA
jgi:2-keto-4-pentenoate hydratase/2-oxohepta-3-ene-1,7-dioic acid hydratase in catechol pathway